MTDRVGGQGPCDCRVKGCRCARLTRNLTKCDRCLCGEHCDSHSQPLCSSVPCRIKTTLATHRVLFTIGKQPMCCAACARQWNGQHVPTWELASDGEYARKTALADLGLLYSDAEALKWLQSSHPQLYGARPIDLLGSDRTHEVLAIIDQLRSGAYV